MKKNTIIIFIISSLFLHIFQSFGESQVTKTLEYKDIQNHWAKKQILDFIELGLLQGSYTKTGVYVYPDNPVSRGEFLKLLTKGLCLKVKPKNTRKFSDIPSTGWLKETFDNAYSNGIITGYKDGTVRPYEKLSMAQIGFLICKAKGWEIDKSWTIKSLKDVSTKDWYYKSAVILVNKKIVTAKDGLFKGEMILTKADAVNILSKIIDRKAVKVSSQISRSGSAIDRGDSSIGSITSNNNENPKNTINSKNTKNKKKKIRRSLNNVTSTPKPTGESNTPKQPNKISTTVVKTKILLREPKQIEEIIKTKSDSVRIKGNVEGRGNLILSYSVDREDGSGKSVNIKGNTNIPIRSVYQDVYRTDGEFEITDLPLQADLNTIKISLKDEDTKSDSVSIRYLKEVDSDRDGLLDYYERKNKTSVTNPDTDNDGLKDGEEVYMYSSSPLSKDSDKDGLMDKFEAIEMKFLMDPTTANTISKERRDDILDSDGDWLTNIDEQRLGTNPLNPDSDGDGLLDGTEVIQYKTNPLKSHTDGNALSDLNKALKSGVMSNVKLNKEEQSVIKSVYDEYLAGRTTLNKNQIIAILDVWKTKETSKGSKALIKIPALKSLSQSSSSMVDDTVTCMVKLFQVANDLNVSGKIDSSTTERMIQPSLWKRLPKLNSNETIYKEGFGNDSAIVFDTGEKLQFEPVYYSQNRGAWSTVPYYAKKKGVPQNGRIITKNGCGPTSMAMIVASIANRNITPDIMAEFSMENDSITEGYDTKGDLYPKAAKKYNIKCELVGSIKEVIPKLEDGEHLAIASMGGGHFTGGGHLIALMGVKTINDEKRVLVYDSNSGNNSYFKYGKDNIIMLTARMGQVLVKPEVFDKEKAIGYWIFSKF